MVGAEKVQCRVGPGRRPGGSSSSPVVPERPSACRHCRVRDVMADTSSGGERQQRGHPKAESGERAELDRQGEAGREASHGMSETFCSACSSQVGRLPMARQKPPCCSPALRSGGMCGQKAASVVVVGPSFILLLPRRRDSPGCWGRGGVCAPRDGRLPWDTSTRKAASRPLSCRFSPPRCSWPCPSAVPSHKGFPNPCSGLAWICSSAPHRELRGNGVKERLGLQAGH